MLEHYGVLAASTSAGLICGAELSSLSAFARCAMTATGRQWLASETSIKKAAGFSAVPTRLMVLNYAAEDGEQQGVYRPPSQGVPFRAVHSKGSRKDRPGK